MESKDSLDEYSNDSPSVKYDYHLFYECLLDTILFIEDFEIFCLHIKPRETPLFELSHGMKSPCLNFQFSPS